MRGIRKFESKKAGSVAQSRSPAVIPGRERESQPQKPAKKILAHRPCLPDDWLAVWIFTQQT
jgi:hypothetical protein